jgi:hypothetical protein
MSLSTDFLSAPGFLGLALLVSLATGSQSFAGTGVDYEKSIKPLLKTRCYACHGALKQKAGLRLDTVDLMRKGGDSGAAIIPRDPAKSIIVARVTTTDEEEAMPPMHEGERFSAEQVTLLKEWIAQGAPGPTGEQSEKDPRDHWAFKPRTRPAVPIVRDSGWCQNPVDAFIRARLEEAGLRPAPEAPREVLVRRLYLDLIGVPPSWEELQNEQTRSDSDWYEKLVERLLSDPRHGERWGRHWMDIWRYSDWWGLGAQLRNSQKHMWHFRDWIVESLNADLPYDEMVRLMVAGDELAPSDPAKLRATGFLARNWFLFNRNTWMEDTVEHVGKGLMGLTMNCAKCHDHKYDPISQVDFYRMRALFEPYHVRMDLVPGEVDLERDGIPRAFDGVQEVATYRFERGEESKPDKSRIIEPGTPQFFTAGTFAIHPVALPIEAKHPERQPWVLETYSNSAVSRLEKAREAARVAERNLEEARKKEESVRDRQREPEAEVTREKVKAPPGDSEATDRLGGSQSLIKETFEKPDVSRWILGGGDWKFESGGLVQRKDGKARSTARWSQGPIDVNFEAQLKFTTAGGSTYRSVGIAFDVSSELPAGIGALNGVKPDDSEVIVYVSSATEGAKVQAAYRKGTSWVYPVNGMKQLDLPLNVERSLLVRVSGNLLNVSLDGKHLFAWRTPMARRAGALQIFTFDAVCTFHSLDVMSLAENVAMKEPSVPSAPAAVKSKPKDHGAVETSNVQGLASAREAAQGALEIAQLAVQVAQAELESIRARAAAMRASWTGEDNPEAMLLRASAVSAERQETLARAQHTLALRRKALETAVAEKKPAAEKELKTAQAELDKAQARAASKPSATESFQPLTGAKWVPTRFLSSGKDDPEVRFPSTSSGRRTALAQWMTSPENPLVSRVAANHVWGRHFGTHLAGTPFDLGRAGNAPTHPELLDWLASELVEHGWSLKHLHRLIVNSSAYKMSSSIKGMDVELAKDPDNARIWRRLPVRLEAEAIRDAMLTLSGEMDWSRGGPPVVSAGQAASKRRSLYFYHSNNDRNLFLTTFDGPMVKECYRREQSVVPQQALALINGSLSLEASKKITDLVSKRLRETGADSNPEFVESAFLYITGIRPKQSEKNASIRALEEWRTAFPGAGSDVAAREQLVWVLLNHNDFVTLR